MGLQFGAALILWNLITFFAMGYDKRCARKHKWRVPEKTLFTMAWALGGVGVGLGMLLFRHKTKHWSFRILVPAGILVNGIILYLIFCGI